MVFNLSVLIFLLLLENVLKKTLVIGSRCLRVKPVTLGRVLYGPSPLGCGTSFIS